MYKRVDNQNKEIVTKFFNGEVTLLMHVYEQKPFAIGIKKGSHDIKREKLVPILESSKNYYIERIKLTVDSSSGLDLLRKIFGVNDLEDIEILYAPKKLNMTKEIYDLSIMCMKNAPWGEDLGKIQRSVQNINFHKLENKISTS